MDGVQISADATDSDILAWVCAGDPGAYAELVRRYAPIARRTALVLGAGADADDVVQESLVKAYRAAGSFRAGEAFRPWLLKIVANEARNHLRGMRRRIVREQAAAILTADLFARSAEVSDPATTALDRDRADRLLTALRALPERDRLVVSCRYLLELDEAETAVTLGWPRGTVKSRLHRALRKMRAELAALDEGVNQPVKEVGRAH